MCANDYFSMTSGSSSLDNLIKEYLIFKGFVHSARQFDAELKGDKDKGFRAELVVEQLVSYITAQDLSNLKDFWSYLDCRVFSRLELRYHNSTKRLYFSLLKYYVVYAATNNRQDKLSEFFSKMAVELQQHTEWKDWFALPFIRNPETNEMFSTYFTRQWQEALQLSLFNYISIIFQSMPAPSLLDVQRSTPTNSKVEDNRRRSKVPLLRGSTDMVDDFYTLTQSIPLEDPNLAKQKKSIVAKGIAKVKGQNSALAGRTKAKTFAASTNAAGSTLTSTPLQPQSVEPTKPPPPSLPASDTTAATNVKPRKPMDHHEMRQELFSLPTNNRSNIASVPVTAPTSLNSNQREEELLQTSTTWPEHRYDGDFVLSGHHVYDEHNNSITHAKFSRSGNVIASADIDGVVKVWTKAAVPSTVASVISKHHVLSLEFVDHSDTLLLIGGKPGHVKIFETTTKKSLKDLLVMEELSGTKISDMTVDESGRHFACSSLVNGANSGNVSTWDIELGERQFTHDDEAIQSVQYFSNGNSLLLGCVDGTIKILDIRQKVTCKSWKAHSGKIYCMQLSNDRQSCFTMDSDNTVSQWNLSTGKLLQSFSVHDGAAGPYVFSQAHNHKQIQTPKDKVFSLNAKNTHFLTCHKNSALIYKIIDGEAKPNLSLGSHRAPVVAIDWANGETDTCLTADMLGHIKLSTLL